MTKLRTVAVDGDEATVTRLLPLFASNREYLLLAGDLAADGGVTANLVRKHLRDDTGMLNGRCVLFLADAARGTNGEGTVVGTASLLVPHPREPFPWIGLLLVDGARQGGGLGRRAAALLEDGLAAEGWPEVRLAVLPANTRALTFWTKLGYEQYDARPDTEGRPCLVFRKALAPR